MPGFEQIFDVVVVTCAAVAGSAIATSLALSRRRGERQLADGQLYRITASAGSNRAEPFFISPHALLRPSHQRLVRGQPWIALELSGREGLLSFQVWIPLGEEPLVASLLRAAYPDVELTPLADGTPGHIAAQACARVQLAERSDLPIRTVFPADPFGGLLSAVAAARDGESITFQLLVRPRSSGWQLRAKLRAQRLRDGRGWSLLGLASTSRRTAMRFEREQAAAIEAKAANPGFDCELWVAAVADRDARAREHVRAVGASLRPYAAANSFRLRFARPNPRFARRFAGRAYFGHGGFILTPAELAAIWHLPTDAQPQVETIRSPKLPPPVGVSRGERVLGRSNWRGDDRPVGLSIADSREHLYLLGPTGTGKSTAMLNLAAQDIAAGRGVGVLDPKGDLVRELLARIPRERIKDVILIAPDDNDLVVGINPLECAIGEDPDLVAENTLTIFKRIYERSWGMRTDDILKAALLTLLRRPGSTLAHVPLLLTNAPFRTRILRDVQDPLGLDQFWRWFGQLSDAQRTEATGPVLNKLRDFLIRPRLRRLLCQSSSKVDLRKVVDTGQILLADLSVGRWGATPSALIGSFLIAKLWQAVLARSGTPEEDRRDFFLFIDEFQQFLGIAGPFADALAQARSLHLSLTIANQHLGQLSADLRQAITSNARSRAVFQCGQDDASTLARQFAPLDAAALMSLPRFAMAARLSIDGQTSDAFTMRTLPPAPVTDYQIAAEVRGC
ncbi:MAG TPA: hypothetical protein VGS17_07745, partial [Candidatus Limnocylindria bacterium]|nr:hypothetical protein [Candidatus Limnocylindria bacterium]